MSFKYFPSPNIYTIIHRWKAEKLLFPILKIASKNIYYFTRYKLITACT